MNSYKIDLNNTEVANVDPHHPHKI